MSPEVTYFGVHSAIMNHNHKDGKPLTPAERFIVGYVTSICHANPDGYARTSNGNIAHVTGQSISAVEKSISRLIKAGCLYYDNRSGRRYRWLRTHMPQWDGGKKRVGRAMGIKMQREILKQPIPAAEKLHLQRLYLLYDTDAKPSDESSDDNAGVHYESVQQTAESLNIPIRTVRDHRKKWLNAGIVERVFTTNDHGYRLTKEAYRRISNGEPIYPKPPHDNEERTAKNAERTAKNEERTAKNADLYESLYESLKESIYERCFHRKTPDSVAFTEEGEDTVSHTEEVTPTFTEKPVSFEEILAPFHRDDERTGDEVSVAAQNTVSVVTADDIPQWIAEAIAPSERRQTHENALRAPRYIAPDFEYGSAEHTAWLDAHADELY